ncbi:acyltransferase [Alloiococcus sp. CFN-8]|uniref:acyltransferase n=1 Tax=Alloiococcus sp. CFN-8 TaxID=3416081 RepID=UPI003CE90A98
MNKKEKNINLDLIRFVAVFSVISVHFFLNNGFYKQEVVGERMYIMVFMRTALMVCVPLFLLLTGYLMNKKTLSKKYYYSINKTLWIYVIASIFIALFKQVFLNKPYTLREIILGILGFNIAGYSWYVKMYIGLFLLIPFFNVMINNLTKNQKKILIITLIILTTLPSLTNIFNFTVEGWWQNPTISNKYNPLIPNWWTNIYPITYYFIGAYLFEHDIAINKKLNLVVFFLAILLFGAFNIYRSYPGTFVKGIWVQWGSFQNLITSVLLFVYLSHLNLKNLPMMIKRIIKKISELSLGIYLTSEIFDLIIYTQLNNSVSTMTHRLNYYFLVVPTIFILSSIASWLASIIYKGITMVFNFIKEKQLV